MGIKKLVTPSGSREEFLRELNKIAEVVWKEMPHEPCKYQRLSATVSRVVRQQREKILEARDLINELLEEPLGMDVELRSKFEEWVLETRPYGDDPECNDSSVRATSMFGGWDDDDDEEAVDAEDTSQGS